ncbi:MAG: ATP--guanido phosphotransferase [Clostridiales bacterium]|nr:ATP--guanido phosphotransferase [Clostridiales bacterium]
MSNKMIPDNDVVISSRIRLARNFEDLPFSTDKSQEIAKLCVTRVENVLLAEEEKGKKYFSFPMSEFSAEEQFSLVEDHLISRELMQHTGGTLLLREDKKVALMVNEEDHIRLQTIEPGAQLMDAAREAFEVEDLLQDKLTFAYDHQLGYLTACPTNTGTGMRASYMFHLPMLTLYKQMGTVNQSVAKLGLTIRGIYGEGSEALGNVYQVSNQITLGKTEEEIMAAVVAVGKQIIAMERALRKKTREENRLLMEDQIYRSFGLLQFARRMAIEEFMQHWSNIRVGAASQMLPFTIKQTDQLLSIAQDAHVKNRPDVSQKPIEGINMERAKQVRVFMKKAMFKEEQ